MTPEEVFAKLTDDELAALAEMSDVRAEARAQLEERQRVSGSPHVRAKLEVNIKYLADEEKPDRAGRIRMWGAGAELVEVWNYNDGQWGPKRSLALPAGYDSSGEGLQMAFSLSPYSNDYHPANWARLNELLRDVGAVHGPSLTWAEYESLPGTRLDHGSRRELLLERLLGDK
jgi:hypothetical protein